jgi:hypothetical protein
MRLSERVDWVLTEVLSCLKNSRLLFGDFWRDAQAARGYFTPSFFENKRDAVRLQSGLMGEKGLSLTWCDKE